MKRVRTFKQQMSQGRMVTTTMHDIEADRIELNGEVIVLTREDGFVAWIRGWDLAEIDEVKP